MSNNSPRDLIILLSHIYDQQSMLDGNVNIFSKEAIDNGLLNFAKKYEYRAFYADSAISQKIITQINRLLKIGKKKLTQKDIATEMKVSQGSASSYTKEMKEYNLIEVDQESASGVNNYYILDPKISYLIDHEIYEIEK